MRQALAALLLLVAAGCTSQLPVVESSRPGDAALSCPKLDGQIDRVASIRAAAIEEAKVQAINDLIGAPQQEVQVVLGIIAIGLPVSPDRPRHYERARQAADDRLMRLLALKLQRDCPARTVGDGHSTDIDVAVGLDQLAAEYATGKLAREQLLARRADWLNLIE